METQRAVLVTAEEKRDVGQAGGYWGLEGLEARDITRARRRLTAMDRWMNGEMVEQPDKPIGAAGDRR